MNELLEQKAHAEQQLLALEARASGQPSFELAPSLQNEIRALEEELRLLSEATGGSTPPQRVRTRANPFVGLVPFEESDRDRYFGRSRPARELLELATQRRFSVLLGRSEERRVGKEWTCGGGRE